MKLNVFYVCKYKFFVPQTRKNIDKYKIAVATYIKGVNKHILWLQSLIIFMWCKYNFLYPKPEKM